MAPNVTLHFFRANDINGDVLLEITDEDEFFKGLSLKPDLYAVGGGEVVLARRVGFSLLSGAAVAPESFVRVLVHAYSDTDYYTGFFLDKREQVVVDPDEDGGEEFHLGGPGPKFYLDRSILGITDHLGAGWHLDLESGVWRWKETATAGQILNRILNEDAARGDPALPDLTKSFTGSLDSNGDAWSTDIAEDGNYEIPIGRSYLQILFDLEDASGLLSTVNLGTVAAPVLELEGWNAYGEDVTATAFAAGKVILREGVNIADTELKLEGRSLRKANRAIVGGKDGVYEYVELPGWSPGDYVKYAYIEYPNSSNETILHRVGLRWLRRQENADKELTVPIVPGADEGAGFYFPKPTGPLWLGNTITVDTAADLTTPTSIDLDNEDELVTGFELELGPAGDTSSADKKAKSWDVKVRLNVERGGNAAHPDQSSVGSSGCRCLRLCDGAIACEDLTDSDLTAGTAANGDAENTAGTQWSGGNGGTSGYHTSSLRLPHGGTRSYGRSSSVVDTLFAYTFLSSQVFSGGVRYVLELWTSADGNRDLGTEILKFGVNGGDEEIAAPILVETVTDTDGDWARIRICWTPDEDRTGVRLSYQTDNDGGSYNLVDDLVLYTAPSDLEGASGRAARCDHRHHAADIEGLSTGGYTDEQAQDAVGSMLADTATVDLTYTDATPALKADVIPGGIKLDDLGTPDDNTDLNATTGHHGLLPKLPNNANAFLDGTGAFAGIPPAAGGAVLPWHITPIYGGALTRVVNLGANNRCIYVPCTIPLACTITGIRIRVGTAAGTISVGLYDASGNRLITSGSVSTPGGLTTVGFSGGATYAAAAGRYYMALSCSTTGATFGCGDNDAQAAPSICRFEESAHPCPSTATFAAGDTSRQPSIIATVSGGYPT